MYSYISRECRSFTRTFVRTVGVVGARLSGAKRIGCRSHSGLAGRFLGYFALLLAALPLAYAQTSASSNQFQVVALPANDLLYSLADGYLYASVPTGTNSRSQTLCQINPETGQLGASIPLGRDPGKLASSDDGRYIYVITDTNKITKIDVTTQTKVLTINLGSSSFGLFKATDLAVMPGHPDTVAVICGDTPGSREIRIYDGQSLRPSVGPALSILAFGTNASTLYGFDAVSSDRSFCRMSVTAGGIALEACQPRAPLTGVMIQSGDQIFTGAKGIFDPLTFSISFPLEGASSTASGSFAIDGESRQAFYALSSGVIRVYSLRTFLPMGDINIGPFGGPTGKIVRWGPNGLAYRAGTNSIVIGKSTLIQTGAATDLSISLEASPTNAPPNSVATVRCNFSNNGSNAAQAITLKISVSAPSTISSAALPNGSCQNNGNSVTCSLGSLPALSTNSTQLQVFLSGSNGVHVTASIISQNVETNYGNNTAMMLLAPNSVLETVGSLSLPVVQMAADPNGSGIYLALGDSLANWGNSIVHFNPLTGQFSEGIYVGSTIKTVSVSRDGSTIFVGSSGMITRIDANSRRVLSRIALTNSSYVPTSIAISPQDPSTFAVWQRTPPSQSSGWGGVGFNVYRSGDLIAATNLPGSFYRMGISEDGNRVGAFRGSGPFLASQFDLASAGLTNLATREESFLSLPGEEEIKYASGLVFGGPGWVYDPAALRVRGTFVIPGQDGWPSSSAGIPLVEPDLENGRVYFVRNAGGGNVYLHAFDATHYRLIDSILIPGLQIGPSQLLRWGQDGLAFLEDFGSDQTVLHFLRSRLIPRLPASDLALHLEGGANPGRTGQIENYSLSVTNQGLVPVDHARVLLTFSSPGTLADLQTDGGIASAAAGKVQWDLGSIQPGGQFTLSCRFTPSSGPLLKVIATIDGGGVDRDPSNDTARHIELVAQSSKQDMTAALDLPVRAVVTDDTDLYASLGEDNTPLGNSILHLKPATWEVAGLYYIGSDPGPLALDSSKKKLFVILQGESSCRTIDLSKWETAGSFSISNGVRADRLAIVPGFTGKWLINRQAIGLTLFDNGQALPHMPIGLSGFVFSDTTSNLYGFDKIHSGIQLYKLALQSDGLAIGNGLLPVIPEGATEAVACGGMIYLNSGRVLSPALQAQVQRFPLTSGVSVQACLAEDRLVSLSNLGSTNWVLESFERSTGGPTGTLPLNDVRGSPAPLQKWGTAGLAFNTTSNQLFIISAPFFSGGPGVDLALHEVVAPRLTVPGRPFSLGCSFTNRSDKVAADTALSWKFNFNGDVSQIQISVGTVTLSSNQVLWNIGDVPPQTHGQLRATFRPAIAQVMTNLWSLSSSSPDPLPGNNILSAIIPVQTPSTNPVILSSSPMAADLVYDKARGLLWATITNGLFSNSIVPIDPLTGVFGPAVDVFSEPGRLAFDDDATSLYYLLPKAGGVGRTVPQPGAPHQFVSLGADPSYPFYSLQDLIPLHHQPLKVAVSFASLSRPNEALLAIVFDGQLQTNIGRALVPPGAIECDPAGTHVYSLGLGSALDLVSFNVDTNGLAYVSNAPGVITGNNLDWKQANGRLFSSSGQMISLPGLNGATNFVQATNTSAVEPDLDKNRIFYATKSPVGLQAINLTNSLSENRIALPGVTGTIHKLVRWGFDGLAFLTTSGQIFIMRSPLVPIPPDQDFDSDGIPDSWETLNGLNPYTAEDATLDYDGDGLSNREEFLAGTNPLNPASTLRLDCHIVDVNNLALAFTSSIGRTYRIEGTSAALGNEWNTVAGPIAGSGGIITNIVAIPTPYTNQFFRVMIVP